MCFILPLWCGVKDDCVGSTGYIWFSEGDAGNNYGCICHFGTYIGELHNPIANTAECLRLGLLKYDILLF